MARLYDIFKPGVRMKYGKTEVMALNPTHSMAKISKPRDFHSEYAIKYIYELYADMILAVPGLILSLRPANERRCYNVTPSLIRRAQT